MEGTRTGRVGWEPDEWAGVARSRMDMLVWLGIGWMGRGAEWTCWCGWELDEWAGVVGS